jgi:small nuclear ribonucleoprotein (snRNP)-like protein
MPSDLMYNNIMEINKKFFPILTENEENYFAQLTGVLNSVDEYCNLQITHAPTHYIFRLAPSIPKYTNNIIKELVKFHNVLGIRLDFSKSMKTTATINFKIYLDSC